MNIEELREYCLSKPGTTEEFPFDEDTLVFKVKGKMFVLTSLEKWEAGNGAVILKCDPIKAQELREEYPDEITSGYHMSNKHWNDVRMTGHLSQKQIIAFIDHSYALVVSKFTKKLKAELDQLKP